MGNPKKETRTRLVLVHASTRLGREYPSTSTSTSTRLKRVLVLLVSVRVLVSDKYSLRDEYYEYSSEYLPLQVLALSEYSSLCEYSLSIRTMYLAYVIRSSLHMHGVGYRNQRWLALLW